MSSSEKNLESSSNSAFSLLSHPRLGFFGRSIVISPFITALCYLSLCVTPSYAQWSVPQILHDTTGGLRQEDAKAAISKTGIIAVVVKEWGRSTSQRLAVYRSNDQGKSYARCGTLEPNVVVDPYSMYLDLYKPGGIGFDSFGNLWVLWRWNLDYDLLPYSYNGILSKSTDGGETFQDVYKYTPGGLMDSWKLVVDSQDNIHVLRDTTIRGIGTYPAYVCLERGDPTKVFKTILPFVGDGVDFAVLQDSIVQFVFVYSTATDSGNHHQVTYCRTVDGGKSFESSKLLDTVSIPKQLWPKIVIDGQDNTLIVYTVDNAESQIAAVHSHDAGVSFTAPYILGSPAMGTYPILKSDSASAYLLIFSKAGANYTQLQLCGGVFRVVDSATFSGMERRDIVVGRDHSKYIWLAKFINNFGYVAYSSSKDVPVYVSQKDISVARQFSIANYPNPFNSSTILYLDAPVQGIIEIRVYNTIGELVDKTAAGPIGPGQIRMSYQPKGLASGAYFLTAVMKNYVGMVKLIYVR